MSSQQKTSEKLRNFSDRLRGRMAKLGLQQNELAQRIGVAPAAVSNWLSGENAAKGRNLRLLSEALACDPHWLSGEDVPTEGLRQEDFPQAEIRQQCHQYLDQVLDRCRGDRNRMSWVLVELERHFPPPQSPSSTAGNPSYRPLNSISADEAATSAAAAERALEMEGRGSRPSGGVGEPSGGKSATSHGTSEASKDKK